MHMVVEENIFKETKAQNDLMEKQTAAYNNMTKAKNQQTKVAWYCCFASQKHASSNVYVKFHSIAVCKKQVWYKNARVLTQLLWKIDDKFIQYRH